MLLIFQDLNKVLGVVGIWTSLVIKSDIVKFLILDIYYLKIHASLIIRILGRLLWKILFELHI